MKRVFVKNSKQAVEAISKDIEGKKIRIKDVASKQNVIRTGNGVLNVVRRFRPNCRSCLEESGYAKAGALPGYIDIYGSELKMPKKLELCRTLLNGNSSSIGFETEDGISFSIAFPEGCKGSLVTFCGAELIPVPEKHNGAVPFIIGDPGVVPVEMVVTNLNANFIGYRAMINDSESFWKQRGRADRPVLNVKFETISRNTGCDNCTVSRSVLKFLFSPLSKRVEVGGYKTKKFSFDISFGDGYVIGEPIKWIDVTRFAEETIRYEVENRFRDFLHED